MKNRLLLSAIIVSGMVAASGCAAGIVTERPAEVVYTRPIAPGPGYVWTEGDWYWGGGRYQWRQGRWDRPRQGRNWNAGHWESSGHGWRWRHGGWRR